MTPPADLLSTQQLLEVFNLTKTATAIHVTEDAIIQTANDAMLQIWGKDRSVIGKSLADALPELVGQPFIEMFKNVWQQGLTLSGIDTAADLLVDGKIQTYYFDFEYRAIKDSEGKTICILHSAVDVTARFLGKVAMERAAEKEAALQREQALNEELAAANEELLQTQENLHTLNTQLEERVAEQVRDWMESEVRFQTMAEGTDLLIAMGDETSNAVYFNKAWTNLTGRSVTDLLQFGWVDLVHPDDQKSYLDAYLSAFKKQESFTREVRIRNRAGEYRWLLGTGPPRFRSDGSFAGHISSYIDITERKQQEIKTKELADELLAINEEMTSSNEELMAANEDLLDARKIIEESEARFRLLIKQAPVAINVFKGPDLIIDAVNDKMLEIWGKSASINGLRLIDAMPELVGQPFLDILHHVITSGKTFYGNESKAVIMRNNEEVECYFNLIYQPLKDENGVITGILQVANEVTEQVKSRSEVQKAEEMMRMAIEAAKLGSWHVDSKTKELKYNSMLAKLFGWESEQPMTYDDALAQVTSEHQPIIKHEIEKAIANGGDYDLTYPQQRFNDGEVAWLRSFGKVSMDDSTGNLAFSGFVMDITEMKKDEERKNDFIGMVSHELKTPLTSLNGYIQILQNKAKKSEDTFMANALQASGKQVKKMTSMINGFLNISRLESGKIMLNKTNFSLDELVKTTIEETMQMDASHVITFSPDQSVSIVADTDKIYNVISNLLSNAIKYAPNDKEIAVKCGIVNGSAQVSVQDKGMGIKEQDIQQLFERYYRVNSNHTISGFGIGLYLSAEIIERHHGKIWAESEPGIGSTFFFSLPLA